MATGTASPSESRRLAYLSSACPAYLVYSGQTSFADLRHPVTIYGDKPKRHSWLSGSIDREREDIVVPLFDYSGFNAAGRKVSGTIEGSGSRMALQQLKAQGIVATDLVRQTGTTRDRRDLLAVLRQPRVPVMEVAAATRQLATLLGAGIPLDEAVATVAGQQENAALRQGP